MESSVNLIWINQTVAPPGHIMHQHSHTSYKLYYILEGNYTFTMGNQVIQASSGCCLLIPPFTPHQTIATEATRSYELKMVIDDDFLNERLKNLVQPFYDGGGLQSAFAYIYENWLSKDPQNNQNIHSILHYVLLRFFISELHYSVSASQFIKTSAYSLVTRNIFHYIEHNISAAFSLDNVSKDLRYTKSYLCTTFKHDTGYTIVDYLNFVKIRFAVISIIFYDDDIYSIRENCAFPSPGHFSRVFKSLVGISAKEFRMACRSLLQKDLHQLFSEEPIVNYRICTIDDAFQSLRSIGTIADAVYQVSGK